MGPEDRNMEEQKGKESLKEPIFEVKGNRGNGEEADSINHEA